MLHPAQLPIERLLVDCSVERTRRGGPGGQHRNKVETAVVIEHRPTGLRGEASERRSQAQNHRQAVRRLRVRLALDLRQAPTNEPSALWQQRISGGRIAVSPEHDDFPALLAEALDMLHVHDYAPAGAAQSLAITSSQFVKLLKIEPAAFAAVNRSRQALDLPPLR